MFKKLRQQKVQALLLILILIGLSVGAIVIYNLVVHQPPSNGKNQKQVQQQGPKKIIEISPNILKSHPIQLRHLTKIRPSEDVLLPGIVQPDPRRVVQVTARAEGRITELHVKEAIQVSQSQVLATIQSREVAVAQTNHLKALIRLELATHQYRRSKDLFKHEIISAREYEVSTMEYKSAKAELVSSRIQLQQLGISKAEVTHFEKKQTNIGELKIRSPINGWIIERMCKLGQSVFPEDPLFIVGKTDKIWIVLNIYEKDIPLIEVGMGAEVIVPRGEDRKSEIPAKVARISSVIDVATRSAKVWLELNNTHQNLKFGQTISARIRGIHEDRMTREVFALPRSAVHQIEGETIIFLRKSETTFEPRKVETGWTSDDWIEIRKGVNSGDEVAAEGSFNLKSEFLRK